jgi:hypothetical protein
MEAPFCQDWIRPEIPSHPKRPDTSNPKKTKPVKRNPGAGNLVKKDRGRKRGFVLRVLDIGAVLVFYHSNRADFNK